MEGALLLLPVKCRASAPPRDATRDLVTKKTISTTRHLQPHVVMLRNNGFNPLCVQGNDLRFRDVSEANSENLFSVLLSLR